MRRQLAKSRLRNSNLVARLAYFLTSSRNPTTYSRFGLRENPEIYQNISTSSNNQHKRSNSNNNAQAIICNRDEVINDLPLTYHEYDKQNSNLPQQRQLKRYIHINNKQQQYRGFSTGNPILFAACFSLLLLITLIILFGLSFHNHHHHEQRLQQQQYDLDNNNKILTSDSKSHGTKFSEITTKNHPDQFESDEINLKVNLTARLDTSKIDAVKNIHDNAKDAVVVVETECGSYESDPIYGNNGLSFRQIAYASPPIGRRRWLKPRPIWMDKQLCELNRRQINLKRGKEQEKEEKKPIVCVQLSPITGRFTGQEDCLYMDIFTPSLQILPGKFHGNGSSNGLNANIKQTNKIGSKQKVRLSSGH